MEKFIDDYFNGSALRSTPTTLNDLRERFKHRFTSTQAEQSDEFFFLFKQFREETSKTKGWSKSRAEMMERLENKVRTFKPDIKFSDLSTATMGICAVTKVIDLHIAASADLKCFREVSCVLGEISVSSKFFCHFSVSPV